MKRSEIKIIPGYFDRYINLVEDIDLFDAFANSIDQLENINLTAIKKIGNKTYLPNKWTVNEIIQHISDIERLLTAGALRFARGESNYVISFDEESITKQSKANNRPIEQVISELIAIRKSTIALYSSFDRTDFQRSGINWKYKISVEAMGFNIIGHQIHHLKIIQDRYLSLVSH